MIKKNYMHQIFILHHSFHAETNLFFFRKIFIVRLIEKIEILFHIFHFSFKKIWKYLLRWMKFISIFRENSFHILFFFHLLALMNWYIFSSRSNFSLSNNFISQVMKSFFFFQSSHRIIENFIWFPHCCILVFEHSNTVHFAPKWIRSFITSKQVSFA